MPQTAPLNRRIVLAERPMGEPTASTLRLEAVPLPKAGVGQMLLRTQYLSLDPYMRGRMNDAPSYAPPVNLGEVMVGGTVGQVVESHVAGFAGGDWVLSYSGWQDYALSDGVGVTNLIFAWITKPTILLRNCSSPAPRASTSISKMSGVLFLMR